MRYARWWPALILPAGIVLAWLAGVEQHRLGHPWTFLVSALVPGLVLIGSGLVIWYRRPQNRCGWLLAAAGLAWYVGSFEHAVNPDVALGAFAFGNWHNLFLGWALLAFPSGRLLHQRDRVLVGVLLGLLSARSLSRLFLHVPADTAGYGVENRFVPIHDDRWWRLTEDVFAWLWSAAIVLVFVSVATRWIKSSGPGRRMLSPALFGSAILAASVTYEYVVGWNASIPAVTNVRIVYVSWWAEAAVAVALAAGLIRLRQTRSAVVDLVAELGHDAPPARLEDALSRALGDASLTLYPWSETAGRYVDGDGVPIELTVAPPGRAVTHIENRGERVAAIVHDVALLEDPGLVNAVVAAVRLTIDNEQLQAQLEAQLTEIAASRARIVAAGDAERQRIERDLHDGAQQRLVAIALALRLAESRLDGEASPEVRAVLSQTVDDLQDAIGELRDLARGIHPTVLDSGLRAALESIVDRSPTRIRLAVELDAEPPRAVARTAYFAVSEALTNVTKHANADEVTVRVVQANGAIRVEVTDDGDGGADTDLGTGLRGVADRIAAVGGTLRLHSPPGAGTRFEVELPCGS